MFVFSYKLNLGKCLLLQLTTCYIISLCVLVANHWDKIMNINHAYRVRTSIALHKYPVEAFLFTFKNLSIGERKDCPLYRQTLIRRTKKPRMSRTPCNLKTNKQKKAQNEQTSSQLWSATWQRVGAARTHPEASNILPQNPKAGVKIAACRN